MNRIEIITLATLIIVIALFYRYETKNYTPEQTKTYVCVFDSNLSFNEKCKVLDYSGK